MARTPSMTCAECEAALGVARGSIRVDGANRGLVKKWLVAFGYPAYFVGGLSMAELQMAYNNQSGWQDKLNRKKAEADTLAAETGSSNSDDSDAAGDKQAAENHVAAGAIMTGAASDSDAAKALQTLRDLFASSVDETKVRDIVNAAIAEATEKMSITHRVEMVNPDGTMRKVDGAVHPMFPTLVRAAQARKEDGHHLNIWIAGEASSGKTTACRILAKALERPWYFNGAISMPHEMLGFIDAGGTYHTTPFRQGYTCEATTGNDTCAKCGGAVYTFDEVDRCSDPNALLAVNPHLENGIATFPDRQVHKCRNSLIIATGNSWGLGGSSDYVGACKLDGAFLDRFHVKIPWNIDESFERSICSNEAWCRRVQAARAKARAAGLKVMITMRASLAGAALIAAGMTENQAADMTYLANLTADQKRLVD